jgi:hypothetical protein
VAEKAEFSARIAVPFLRPRRDLRYFAQANI